MRLFAVELHVGGDNLLEGRAEPVIFVVVVQEGVVAEELGVQCLIPAKLRPTDSVNPRSTFTRAAPR